MGDTMEFIGSEEITTTSVPKVDREAAAITCSNVRQHTSSGRFWFYVLSLIIVIVVSWYLGIVRRNDGWYNSLNRGFWAPPIEALLLGSALLLILLGYITFYSDAVSAGSHYRSWVNLSYFLILLFFLIWSILLFGQQNIRGAFIFAVLIFLVMLWHFYCVWKTGGEMLLPEVIVLIGSIVLIICNWNLMTSNP